MRSREINPYWAFRLAVNLVILSFLLVILPTDLQRQGGGGNQRLAVGSEQRAHWREMMSLAAAEVDGGGGGGGNGECALAGGRARCGELYLTCHDKGGHGNTLGFYASLLITADRMNMRPYISMNVTHQLGRYYRPRIPQLLSGVDQEHTSQVEMDFGQIWAQDSCHALIAEARRNYSGEMGVDAPPLEGVKIRGYPWDVQKWACHRKKILRELGFRRGILRDASRFLTSRPPKRTSNKPITYVSVHIRLLDYESVLRKNKYSLLNVTYFHKAMDIFRRRIGSGGGAAHFVIGTNDHTWCQAHLSAPDVTILTTDLAETDDIFQWRKPPFDMAVLASCRYHILTYGTFSFWTAFLAPSSFSPDNSTTVITPCGYSGKLFLIDRAVRSGLYPGWTCIDPN